MTAVLEAITNQLDEHQNDCYLCQTPKGRWKCAENKVLVLVYNKYNTAHESILLQEEKSEEH